MKLVVLFLVLASLASARASTVTFSLEVNPGASSFQLFATSSAGDNDGIASYGVPLLGSILTLDHNSPNAVSGAGSTPSFTMFGFSLLRSADGATTVAASQDTITPNDYIVYGFGQTAGDLSTIPVDIATSEQQVYGARLLLVNGTYGATQPSIDLASIDLGANTFDDMNGVDPLDVSAATIVTETLIVPEPTVVALLGLGSLVLLRRRRNGRG